MRGRGGRGASSASPPRGLHGAHVAAEGSPCGGSRGGVTFRTSTTTAPYCPAPPTPSPISLSNAPLTAFRRPHGTPSPPRAARSFHAAPLSAASGKVTQVIGAVVDVQVSRPLPVQRQWKAHRRCLFRPTVRCSARNALRPAPSPHPPLCSSMVLSRASSTPWRSRSPRASRGKLRPPPRPSCRTTQTRPRCDAHAAAEAPPPAVHLQNFRPPLPPPPALPSTTPASLDPRIHHHPASCSRSPSISARTRCAPSRWTPPRALSAARRSRTLATPSW